MKTKLTEISLKKHHYIPEELELGVLHVSEEFGAALHLCACGCGSKVSTPIGIGAKGWKFSDDEHGPSLWPSIGSFQLPCKSHYFITNGTVRWC